MLLLDGAARQRILAVCRSTQKKVKVLDLAVVGVVCARLISSLVYANGLAVQQPQLLNRPAG